MSDKLSESSSISQPRATTRLVPWTSLLAFLLVGFCWGLSVGNWLNKPSDFTPVKPRLLQKADFDKIAVDGVGFFFYTPGDISVHIVPQKEIAKVCKTTDAEACSQASLFGACNVWLPAEYLIARYHPMEQRANWASLSDELVAHEFLHCYLPNWHQPWSDKYDKRYAKP